MSGLRRRSEIWIEGWLSRIANSAGADRRPFLSVEAATYLDSAADPLREQIERVLDEIVDEPSYGYPGRYPAAEGPFAGEIADLNLPGHRIIYRVRPRSILVRLIEPIPATSARPPP